MTALPPQPHRLMYDYVIDRRTGERVILQPEADTAAMREKMKEPGGPQYIGVYDEFEVDVTPCGGHGTQVPAYWRGDEGNEAREAELGRQAKANAQAKLQHGLNDDLI